MMMQRSEDYLQPKTPRCKMDYHMLAMLNRLIVVGLFWCIAFNAVAQKENNVWVGGTNTLIDFNSGNPVVFGRPDNSDIWRTNASYCDANGSLLFYTNGFRVFNKAFQIMQNGDDLNIGDYATFGYNELSVPE
jgi:hypothetical protein